MPLTKRQKRRLKEISKMIESSVAVKNDMDEINLGYAKEIEEILNRIREKKAPEKSTGQLSSDISLYDDSKVEKTQANSKETSGGTNEHQQVENLGPESPSVDAPSWAKSLWKNIARKCHPDVLNFQKYSALEVARRQQWFLESRKHFENAEWNKMLHIGIQLDEWVDDIGYYKQNQILDEQYNVNAAKINELQNSLAWQWGNNWDNLNARIQIVSTFMNSLGIPVPDRQRLVEILVEYELE